MAALFDGVKRMTDDELRMQIAFLRNMLMLRKRPETGLSEELQVLLIR